MTHLIEMARTRTHINEYPKSAPAVPISTISPAPSQVSTTTSPGPNDRRYPKKELGIASELGGDDPAEALSRVLTKQIVPRVDLRVFSDPNEYRRRFCYTEATTTVLEQNAVSLKRIFTALASSGASNPGEGAEARRLVGLSEWLDLMRGLDLVGCLRCSALRHT